MSAAMDMFLSASDSLPFPDVLDIDIKSEIDTLVGGHNDFSGFNFNNLEPLELEDVHEIKWFNSNSNHSVLDFSAEEGGPTMVNPNAVMPVMSLASTIGRSPSPSLKDSHLTFSPATFKITSIKADAASVKKDLLNRLEGIDSTQKKKLAQPPTPIVTKTITKVTPILAKPTLKPIAIKTTQSSPSFVFKNAVRQVVAQVGNGNTMTIRTVSGNTISQTFQRKTIAIGKTVQQLQQQQLQQQQQQEDFRVFPKPAYSYSCLIAMALKNSKSGSLPVSEIYNFMCKHFPYFKTAPSGWKNSVRHNLSLNKCFEKIEKPALNGSQRKGCLWAMNPAKITKMDDEVQKWSRKDPNAIKKAMVNPETLESLERGELKFSCSYDDEECENFGDSCGSAESGEGSDSEEEIETEDTEIDVGETQVHNFQYIQVKDENIKDEDMEEYEEITEPSYDEYEEDKELLRVEMALARKELLEHERIINSKRRRTYIAQEH